MLDNIDLQKRTTWSEARTILSRYRKTAVIRAEQAAMIKDHAAQCNHHIIIAGDMNEPPSSYTYNQLCDNMKDSFREKASGIESTYGGRIPFLRIDYVFVDDATEVVSYHTHKVDYSDHYPITVNIRFQE